MQFKTIFFILTLLTCLTSWVAAEPDISISGAVRSAKTGKYLENVNIEVNGNKVGTISDENGFYQIKLPAGNYTLKYSFIGYKSFKKKIRFHAGQLDYRVNVDLVPAALEMPEVQVVGTAKVPKIAKYEIGGLDLKDISNPLPDAMLAIKTLPGVFSGNDQSSLYHVRGGSYDDNLIRLNGVEIFQPFLVRKGVAENPSVVNPWLVKTINLQTGAYPVFYGDKLSSVLDISYKDGMRTKLRGMAGLSTVRAEAALEGKIGNFASFAVAMRRIDYGYIWKDLKTRGSFNPDFRDIQVVSTLKPARNHTVNLFGLYNSSLYESSPTAYNAQWNPISKEVYYSNYLTGKERFLRKASIFSLNWNYQPTKWLQFKIVGSNFHQNELEKTRLAYTFSKIHIDSVLNNKGQYVPEKGVRSEDFNNKLDIKSSRLLAEMQLKFAGHKLLVGAEKRKVFFADEINEEVQGSYRFSTDPDGPVHQTDNYEISGVSAYLHDYYEISNLLRMQAGLRYSRYSLNKETIFMPRFRITAALGRATDISLAAGFYTQPPLYKEIRKTSETDRASVRSQKSRQATLGVSHHWGKKISNLKLELFYKEMSDLISYESFDVRTVYSGKNDSKGQAWGFDAHLKGMIAPDCISWVSYSFLKARENISGSGQGWVPRPSDQRHILSLKLEDAMERFPGSKIHIRILYGSGLHYTHYYTANKDNGDVEILKGNRNASKLPAYKRFDVGLTQKLHFGNININFNEEVLNLFNKKNIMGYAWNNGMRRERFLSGRTYMIEAQVVFGQN